MENITAKEKIDAIKTYGSCTDEVCYAAKRLEKIGAEPYAGSENGTVKDILERAITQAKKREKSVAVHLSSGTINGLFMITPGFAPIDIAYEYVKENQEKLRWDKPVEKQKEEEEFDRFRDYNYGKRIYRDYDTVTLEVCYAAERLEKRGISPFKNKGNETVDKIVKSAIDEANKQKAPISVSLNSGTLKGIFVISPQADEKFGGADNFFSHLVKNQDKLREDKPIAEQKALEKAISEKKRSLIND